MRDVLKGLHPSRIGSQAECVKQGDWTAGTGSDFQSAEVGAGQIAVYFTDKRGDRRRVIVVRDSGGPRIDGDAVCGEVAIGCGPDPSGG
jgi:hypothetical protein